MFVWIALYYVCVLSNSLIGSVFIVRRLEAVSSQAHVKAIRARGILEYLDLTGVTLTKESVIRSPARVFANFLLRLLRHLCSTPLSPLAPTDKRLFTGRQGVNRCLQSVSEPFSNSITHGDKVM
jgi:hypothetical protein